MNDVRRAWGPSAVTRWSVIVGMVTIVVLSLPGDQGDPDFALRARVLTAIGAAAAGSVVLVLARLTWLRPGEQPLRWARALVTFAVAGAVTGLARAWLIPAVGAHDPLGLPWRVASNTVAAAIWLGLTAIVVDHVRQHRATMRVLERKQVEMEDLARRERDELDAVTDQLRGELLAPVRATLERVRAGLTAVGAGQPAAAEAARIEQAVVTSIRPLSHAMLDADPDPALDSQVTGPVRGNRAGRLVDAASRRVVRSPWLVTLVAVVLSPLMLGPTWGVAFLLVNAIVTWPIYALLLMLLRRTLEPSLQRVPTPVAGVSLLAGYVAATAVVIGVTKALGGLSPRPVPYMWIGLITLTAILVAASVLQAAARLGAEDEAALRKVLARIATALARIRQRLRHEHSLLGALLHGPVQGALLGVASSLEQAPPDISTDDRRVLVGQALDRLSELEHRLESPDDEQSLDDALDGVLMLWGRVLHVHLDVHDDARAALDATPAARAAVADVVSEALTNGFRHGGARTAWVEISLDAGGACVSVVDDGRLAPGASAGAGMGSRLYDECAQQWSLTGLGDGRTELRLMVPVAGSAEARRRSAASTV